MGSKLQQCSRLCWKSMTEVVTFVLSVVPVGYALGRMRMLHPMLPMVASSGSTCSFWEGCNRVSAMAIAMGCADYAVSRVVLRVQESRAELC